MGFFKGMSWLVPQEEAGNLSFVGFLIKLFCVTTGCLVLVLLRPVEWAERESAFVSTVTAARSSWDRYNLNNIVPREGFSTYRPPAEPTDVRTVSSKPKTGCGFARPSPRHHLLLSEYDNPASPDFRVTSFLPHAQRETFSRELEICAPLAVEPGNRSNRFAVIRVLSTLPRARHYSPCGNDLGCSNNIIHLFSMSKSFGLAGWRVGYAVYPAWASEEMVKVQDTLPTHACTASQKIALAALEGREVCLSVCLSVYLNI